MVFHVRSRYLSRAGHDDGYFLQFWKIKENLLFKFLSVEISDKWKKIMMIIPGFGPDPIWAMIRLSRLKWPLIRPSRLKWLLIRLSRPKYPLIRPNPDLCPDYSALMTRPKFRHCPDYKQTMIRLFRPKWPLFRPNPDLCPDYSATMIWPKLRPLSRL